MTGCAKFRGIAKRATFWHMVGCAVFAMFLASSASAAPITYTGFTIADGSLGSWNFKQALVYIRFKSDTANAQFQQFPIDPTNPNNGTVDTFFNGTGTATVTIITPGKRVHATFAPNQIFVSLDLGDTPLPQDPPNIGGRGIGFGSFTATGIEPAYPLAVEDGLIDYGDGVEFGGDAVVSPQVLALPLDLTHETAFSGRAWSCVGFPTTPCSAPNPLKTDKGNLLLSTPYTTAGGFDTLGGGFFFSVLGDGGDSDDQ